MNLSLGQKFLKREFGLRTEVFKCEVKLRLRPGRVLKREFDLRTDVLKCEFELRT